MKTSTSPRAAGAPNSVRAMNSAAARTLGDCVSPQDPNGAGASARASRDGHTGADALIGSDDCPLRQNDWTITIEGGN